MQAILAALHSLVDYGTLHPDELDRMAIPTVGRTEKEFLAPFAPSGRFEGLAVEHLELFNARTGSGPVTALTAMPLRWAQPGPASRVRRSFPP